MDTETRLREAMQTATSAPPEPVAFDLISRRVRRRRRRNTVIAAGALVAVAAATPVWVAQLDGSGEPGQPARSGGPATTHPGEPEVPELPPVLDPAIVQQPWTATRWQQLPWSTTGLPRLLDPVAADTTSLAADPVGRALAAVQPYSDRGDRPIYLLGEDGRWRVQDLVEVEPTGGVSVLGESALSADGTRLALPQPHGLIVIDLTTNTARRHELPGLPVGVSWDPSGHQVLVLSYPEDRYRQISMVVDAESGAWERVPYDPLFTSYAADGTAVEAHQTSHSSYELRRYEPDGGVESAPMPVDLFEDTKAIISAGSDAVVVMRDVLGYTIPRSAGAWPGPTILDIDSGQALAQLPTPGYVMQASSHPLGWANGDTVILRFDDHVVAWDYETGELRRVTEVANDTVPVGLTVTIAAALIEADD